MTLEVRIMSESGDGDSDLNIDWPSRVSNGSGQSSPVSNQVR